MNVFVVPGWYPSSSNAIYGTFVRDQVTEIARNHPEINLGLSLWGQGDEVHLLWARDHVMNLRKYWRFKNIQPATHSINANLTEYYHPALTWTRKIRQGNRQGILQANRHNFEAMQNQYGKVDLIHAHVTFPAGIIAQQLAVEYKVPYLITSHMSPFPFREFLSPSGDLSPLVRDPLQKAAAIVSVSTAMTERLKAFKLQRIHTIPNTCDSQLYKLTSRSPSQPLQLAVVARLVDQKGIDILLEALSKVLPRPFRVNIVGDGPKGPRLQKMAHTLGLSDRVSFTGELSQADTARVIAQCDALVLPSRHESFGVVLIEAMACGKPVIATRCGGPEDIVNPTNGLMAEVENPTDLAEKLIDLLENFDRYDTQAIRKDFEKRFSSRVVTPQIVALYREVVTAQPQV